jgi:P-type Mg2+ transporter
MALLPTVMLPRKLQQRPSTCIHVSPQLLEAAASDLTRVFQMCETSPTGLTEEEAERRLEQYGPNVVTQEHRYGWVGLLGKALVNPLVILLLVLAALSFATGEIRAGVVMLLMVLLGVSLRFVQEARADVAAAKLKAMISVTATVSRSGQAREVPLGQLVPGDVVKLSAGDMIPADVRLISCKDLFVIQSSLTGESYPVEKFEARQDDPTRSPLELRNSCFLGTSVESGTAHAVVVCTGLKN